MIDTVILLISIIAVAYFAAEFVARLSDKGRAILGVVLGIAAIAAFLCLLAGSVGCAHA